MRNIANGLSNCWSQTIIRSAKLGLSGNAVSIFNISFNFLETELSQITIEENALTSPEISDLQKWLILYNMLLCWRSIGSVPKSRTQIKQVFGVFLSSNIHKKCHSCQKLCQTSNEPVEWKKS